MEEIANLVGLTGSELTSLVLIGVGLVVGWVILRVILKLTAALFRTGCLAIILILGIYFMVNWLN